ncbi:hypothetical protein KO02_17535 [Sphingobacterium sp. ML3W]|uniref:DUF4468 domain-containing protein n=1 Tax=Sphingobacterium sp. ML3W TaxID=1538644 RepID=UPI0004F785AD|nr:DUF4468 domain-containing protein [Sphingobacterium sp. ML3W]AIM38285.1 hypothetical protein KO02_17535 [Sphingobacterium sp. ML3W]
MKKIFLLLLMLPLFTKAQKVVDRVTMPTKDGSVFYEEVVSVDSNLVKNVLYIRALKWFADNFNDSNEVKQVEDKENGKIVGSGIFESRKNVLTGGFDRISFMIDITVKDGRYRVQFYDIKEKNIDGKGHSTYGYSSINSTYERQQKDDKYMFRGSNIKSLRFIDEKIKELIQSVNVDLSKPNSSDDF